jgi:DNA-binding transcriptional ArsR family regulator
VDGQEEQPAVDQGTDARDPESAAIAFLTGLLSSRIRARLLAFLVARAGEAFSLTELSRELGTPISSLQHECYKLERIGVIRGRREGASRRYRLVPGAWGEPVIHLVTAALGQPLALRERLGAALRGLSALAGALLVGDLAPTAAGSLQLILVGDVDLEYVQVAQERVAAVLTIPADRLDVAWFRAEEWQGYRATGHPRLDRLRDHPVLAILGTAGDLLPTEHVETRQPDTGAP